MEQDRERGRGTANGRGSSRNSLCKKHKQARRAHGSSAVSVASEVNKKPNIVVSFVAGVCRVERASARLR